MRAREVVWKHKLNISKRTSYGRWIDDDAMCGIVAASSCRWPTTYVTVCDRDGRLFGKRQPPPASIPQRLKERPKPPTFRWGLVAYWVDEEVEAMLPNSFD